MKMKFKILLLAVVFLGIFGVAKNSRAASWYVDNSVSSSGNGQSWSNAWKNFSDIVWGSFGVKAGDTLYISGGSTSQTYNEQLTTGASGTVGNLITISVGQDHGHNGTVIIDGQSNRNYAVYIGGQSYIKLTGQIGTSQKMKLIGGKFAGVELDGSLTNIELAYLEVASNGTSADTNGISTRVSFNEELNIEIHHCLVHDNYQDGMSLLQSNPGEAIQFGAVRIHHNKIYNISDDGIETSLGCDIYDNEFGPRINTGRGHPDQIQFYNSYTRIYNNYFHGNVITNYPGTSNSNIFCDPFSSDITLNPTHIQIFNNLIVETAIPGADDVHRGIALSFAEAGVLSANDILLANNTFVGMPLIGLTLTFGSIATENVSNVIIENNIFKDIGRTGSAVWSLEKGNGTITYGSHGDGADVTVDHNMIYASSGIYKTDIVWNDTFYNWANYKTASGCDSHGISGDPLLNGSYYLNTHSPAIDTGANLSSFFTTDKDGNTHPGVWDIGAYEYTGGLANKSADLNGDHIVNIFDYTLFAQNFGQAGDNIADLNSDNQVNIFDYTLFAADFGKNV